MWVKDQAKHFSNGDFKYELNKKSLLLGLETGLLLKNKKTQTQVKYFWYKDFSKINSNLICGSFQVHSQNGWS